MAPTPLDALRQLRLLYRNAHHIHSGLVDDVTVLAWASPPCLTVWATHQIRSRGWSFDAAHATVSDARRLARRAILCPLQEDVPPEPPITQGADPYNTLMPTDR